MRAALRLARACSARCSTAERARSGSGRSGSTSRWRARTSRARTCSARRGTRRPAGWWSATRSSWARGGARTRSRRTRGRRPTTTPSTCSCAPPSASRAAWRSSSSASPCSTTGARPPSGRWSATTCTRPTPRAPARRSGCRPTWRSGSRPAASAPATRCARASGCTARCRGPRASPRRPTPTTPIARLDATAHFWRSWVGRARIPDQRWRQPILRSALAIKGLTYMPTGATVAALTTSLPGDAGRRAQLGLPLHVDARHHVHAAGAALAQPRLGGRRVHAVRRRHRGRTRTARCRSCTGSTAAATSRRRTRDDLSGYAGARPVRVGNGAFDQRQNDVFGAVLDSVLLHTRRSERLPRRLWPIVESQAECAARVWREPDQGIWEARGEPQHYVSSKLMCWVALDRAAELAGIRGDPELPGEVGGDGGGDPRRHPRARRRRARRAAPALRDRRARRLDAAGGDLRVPAAATTSGCGRACSRSSRS